MDLAPKTATVIRDGVEQVINASEMAAGDIFIIKPGEASPYRRDCYRWQVICR